MHAATSFPVVLSVLVASLPLPAQNVPTVALTKPLAELAEPFTDVAGVRELRDGRVIVIDKRDLVVALVDFQAGTVQQIGRRGDGPGEYRAPNRIYALPGDSTVVVDMFGGRMLLIGPDAKPGGFLNRYGLSGPDTGQIVGRAYPRYVDAAGHWFGEAEPILTPRGGTPTLVDSAAIVRIDRRTGREDTVAFRHLPKDPGRKLFRGMVFSSPNPNPFPAWDTWAVAPDGRIAFVFLGPYHVDFASPSGTTTHGPEIRYDRVKITEAMKRQYREMREKPVLAVSYDRSGSSEMRMVKPPPFKEPDQWPEYLPPYLGSAVWFDGEGTLWIPRGTPFDAPPLFDLIDARGRDAMRVTLPPRAKLVGFGNGTVYVVRLDQDDLQYLQRYRLPRAGSN